MRACGVERTLSRGAVEDSTQFEARSGHRGDAERTPPDRGQSPPALYGCLPSAESNERGNKSRGSRRDASSLMRMWFAPSGPREFVPQRSSAS
jgi:hypothetical protein